MNWFLVVGIVILGCLALTLVTLALVVLTVWFFSKDVFVGVMWLLMIVGFISLVIGIWKEK